MILPALVLLLLGLVLGVDSAVALGAATAAVGLVVLVAIARDLRPKPCR